MDLTKKGKFLALILRHKPETINIVLDKNGYAKVDELISNGDFIFDELTEIVKTDNKGRYEFNDDYSLIRARQGHSIEVDVELEIIEPPEFLYHGTKTEFLSSILDKGLLSMNRQYVHLSIDIETANIVANRRKGKSKILEIKSGEMYNEGIIFYKSKNNVYMVKEVLSKFIKI